ncbi:MAG TPA: hotdog fold thioesterase [Saprospiraceae bacterium]|nr:hotdog fold thioesterase [Saprospiraceae bacterium]
MNTSKSSASRIVHDKMMANDWFSQWLGIQILEVNPGYCRLSMLVREEMLNGFKVAHGGITYSLADSALAFASNSLGKYALSIETSISHLQKVVAGNILTAETTLWKEGKNISTFHVEISNESSNRVAIFKGTVFHSGKNWEENPV